MVGEDLGAPTPECLREGGQLGSGGGVTAPGNRTVERSSGLVGVVGDVDVAHVFLSHNRPWVPVMSMVRWRAVDAEKTRVGRLSWVLVCRCSAVVID